MIKNDMKSVKQNGESLFGMYRGTVEDNNDPEKAGRCRIRVFGVHTENIKKTNTNGIPVDELPWAEPAMGLFEGSVSGFGAWTIPLQGSHVFLFFENGNILQPRYFATVPGIPTEAANVKEGFNDPDDEYPISTANPPHQPNGLNEPDVNKLARGVSSGTIVDSKNSNKKTGVQTATGGSWDEPNSAYGATYPDNKVFATNSGITVEIDDTPNNIRIHVYHPSNSYIEIDNDGNVVAKNDKIRYEIIGDDHKIFIADDSTETIGSNKEKKVGTDETVDIGNDKTETIGRDETKTVGNDEIESIGNDKTKDIGNDETINIGNNKTEIILGNESKRVSGNKTDVVTGNLTETVTGNKVSNTTGSVTHTAGTTVTITAGGVVSIMGTAIRLSNGGTFRKIVNELFQTVFNNHTHSGVTTGSGNTGTPNSNLDSTQLTTVTRAE